MAKEITVTVQVYNNGEDLTLIKANGYSTIKGMVHMMAYNQWLEDSVPHKVPNDGNFHWCWMYLSLENDGEGSVYYEVHQADGCDPLPRTEDCKHG